MPTGRRIRLIMGPGATAGDHSPTESVLANNHVLDWGRAGLHETLDTLAGARIGVVGAGRELDAAAASALLDMGLVAGHWSLPSAPSTAAFRRLGGWAGPGIHLHPDLSTTTVERITELVRRSKQPGDTYWQCAVGGGG